MNSTTKRNLAIAAVLIVLAVVGTFLFFPRAQSGIPSSLTIFPEDATKTGNTAWNAKYGPNAACPPSGAVMVSSSDNVDSFVYTALTANNFAPGDFESCNVSYVQNPPSYSYPCTDFYYPHQNVMNGCPGGNFINAAKTVCRICSRIQNPATYTAIDCGTLHGISAITYWNVNDNVVDLIHKIQYTYNSQTRTYCLLDGTRYDCPVNQTPVLNNLHSCGTDRTCVDSFSCQARTTVPDVAPPKTDPLKQNVFSKILDAVRSFFHTVFGWSITPAATFAPLSTVSIEFKLQNTGSSFVPHSNWTDGTYSDTYGLIFLLDSNGNEVAQVAEKSLALVPGEVTTLRVDYQLPSLPDGNYKMAAVLVDLPQVWNSDNKTWVGLDPVLLDKRSYDFAILTRATSTTTTSIPGPSPSPSALPEGVISKVLASLKAFFCGKFGLFC